METGRLSSIHLPSTSRAALEESITPESVRETPVCLCDAVEKVHGAENVMDELICPTYRVYPNIRERLITQSLQKDLHITRRRCFSQFSIDRSHSVKALMSGAVFEPGYQSSALSFRADVSDMLKSIGEDKNRRCSLTPPASQWTGKRLAIYNSGSEGLQRVHFNGNKRVNLGVELGVVLKAGVNDQPEWEIVSKYEKKVVKRATNPLIVDVNDYEAKHQGLTCRGEFFLPPTAIQDLIKNKFGADQNPAYCWSDMEARELFNRVSTSKPCSIIFLSRECEHTVAVRLIKPLEDQVVIYIHETLGKDNGIALALEKHILDITNATFPGHAIYLLRPAFGLQKDASCCTQFAFEAITAFCEGPNMDNWIVELALGQGACINPEQQANWPKTVRSSRRGKMTDSKSLPDLKEKKFYVSLTSMPNCLLVSNQNKTLFDEYPDAKYKLNEPVREGQQTTLQAHYDQYSRVIGTSKVCLHGTVKRYKNILDWHALKVGNSSKKESSVQKPLEPQKAAPPPVMLTRIQKRKRDSDGNGAGREAVSSPIREGSNEQVSNTEKSKAKETKPTTAKKLRLDYVRGKIGAVGEGATLETMQGIMSSQTLMIEILRDEAVSYKKECEKLRAQLKRAMNDKSTRVGQETLTLLLAQRLENNKLVQQQRADKAEIEKLKKSEADKKALIVKLARELSDKNEEIDSLKRKKSSKFKEGKS